MSYGNLPWIAAPSHTARVTAATAGVAADEDLWLLMSVEQIATEGALLAWRRALLDVVFELARLRFGSLDELR